RVRPLLQPARADRRWTGSGGRPAVIWAASWVLPIAAPAIRDGAVVVEDGRVSWVGPRAEAPGGDVHDLGEGVLLPGLVNAHCHLELTHLGGGRVDASGGFVPWVRALVEARATDTPERVREHAAEGIAAVRAAGTAAVADVSNTL